MEALRRGLVLARPDQGDLVAPLHETVDETGDHRLDASVPRRRQCEPRRGEHPDA
jgi:hypothetical protein